VVLFRHAQHWQLDCNQDRITMKRPALLFLPFIASALLFAAGPNEPKVAPEVDLATAQPGSKPACTAAIAGHQWPDEAADPHFAAALAPYGYPMVCTHSGTTYIWRSATLRAEQPKKVDKPAVTAPKPTPPKN
jgi:hypothetical protein